MQKLSENIDKDWEVIIKEIPSSRKEIEAGIDCYAFGDYPGCVFHMTRLSEIGLRCVARKLKVKKTAKNKPVEFAMWGEVIAAIQNAISELKNAKGNIKSLSAAQRKNREEKIEYYRMIMSDMNALLSLRDKNAHYRDRYDRGEAFSAMYRVKEMMSLIFARR